MAFSNWLERTMVIERTCGVALYAIVLFYVYFALKRAENYYSVRKTLNIYIIILSVMAFFYIPYKSADLYRWLDMTQNWYLVPFGRFFQNRILNSATPVAELMIYFCRLTRIDGVLPAFCSFVFFTNVFYILKDQYKKHNASSENLSCALFALMSTGCFVGVISGVRCFVALSILARCFYDEMYNEKAILKNVIWEVVACLIHSMAIIMLGIRLFFFILQRSDSFFKKLLNICFSIAIFLVILRYGSIYIELALDKADAYVSGAERISAQKWGYIISFFVVLQAMLCVSAFKRKKEHGVKNIFLFSFVLLVIEVIFVFEFNIFHRTSVFLSTMIVPLISQLKLLQEKERKIREWIKLFSIIMLLVSCTRGDLCAYKFFLL